MLAFPHTINKSLPEAVRLESLLKATHTLSEYRLVLKQGEPFSPVILRVHSDPVSILSKLLEQNPKSYTRIIDLLEVGANMVKAGLTRCKSRHPKISSEEEQLELALSEKRIVAMCIEAALREDDFETAYSYVVNRLTSGSYDAPDTAITGQPPSDEHFDNWSWKAALNAGQYIRTARTLRPTHLGTASGNPEIRHLEQRIECLATALRIAPASQLQQVLKTFRRCEEQLDSAMAEEAASEAASEAAWDSAADLRSPEMPGVFESARPTTVRNISAMAAAKASDEAPMSLFDLSRAATRAASRNFSVLSNLQVPADGRPRDQAPSAQEEPRVRKRDQLRDAAVGTLVSSVGWLVGAQPADGSRDT